ncbi:MAG: tRNA (adenosine(37)-N6)-threonylcarbamoyltransferase complex dimerization subunit type 1 TsaB [Traorella sp.]
MRTLVLDTCHKYIVIGCFEGKKCLSAINQLAWKKQSELFFEVLNQCMEQANWNVKDIDQVVITYGPGSYTGERIAMTFAKMLCTQTTIPLYKVKTYMIFAGKDTCEVILDARSNRAYCGFCENGHLLNESIKTIDEIKLDQEKGIQVIGDVEILGEQPKEINFADKFMEIQDSWEEVKNVHTLTPHYLKSKEELVK